MGSNSGELGGLFRRLPGEDGGDDEEFELLLSVSSEPTWVSLLLIDTNYICIARLYLISMLVNCEIKDPKTTTSSSSSGLAKEKEAELCT